MQKTALFYLFFFFTFLFIHFSYITLETTKRRKKKKRKRDNKKEKGVEKKSEGERVWQGERGRQACLQQSIPIHQKAQYVHILRLWYKKNLVLLHKDWFVLKPFQFKIKQCVFESSIVFLYFIP